MLFESRNGKCYRYRESTLAPLSFKRSNRLQYARLGLLVAGGVRKLRNHDQKLLHLEAFKIPPSENIYLILSTYK